VRERGTQSRRRDSGSDGRIEPTPGGPGRFWPTLAIVAIMVAVAGWTTVAVLTLGGGSTAVAPGASPTSPPAPGATLDDLDEFEPFPEELSHEAPELEARLPASWDGATLEIQSWTGDSILAEDDWSLALAAYLERIGRQPADLQIAQAYDAEGDLDLLIGVFRVEGAEPGTLLAAMIEAWGADFPDLETAELTLGGKQVLRGLFADGSITSYWYEHDGAVFDIETSDESIAAAFLETLP
jgi:hypothetical protein